ncbi:transcription factor Clamp-like [Planococcus citri]|uniref:transcription factor Clamp-like n=1 Tax=Planococcus citri TaxID=170843 RepID=UPI0031F964B6
MQNLMALDANGWLRDEHKQNRSDQNAIFITREQPLPLTNLLGTSAKSILIQTQTHHRTEESQRISARMFDPNLQQSSQQSQNQTVYAAHVEKKECDNKNTAVEFPFCYNMNVLNKAHQQEQQQTSNTSSSNVNTDDKSCYRFDAPQPFTYNYALVNHLAAAAVSKCDICGQSFGNPTLLQQHKRIHHLTPNNERSYSCDPCGIFFNNASELKSHKISTHKTTKCCNICGAERGCEHSKTPTKKSKYLRCENNVNSNTVANNFVTGQATINQAPIGVQNGQITKELHHPVKKRGMATVARCHQCNGAGVIFIGVTKHADKPFQCNICEGRFSRYSSLWSHKRLHTGDKPFKCDACGLTFAKAAYLKNHLRVHTGEKPFKCDVCGMQFSQSPHLKNHERIHSGERPYQCEVCEKTFARHSTLWNHRRIHTGEKPYRCDICGSAFNQATHLKNHGKVHTGEKPFRCDICEQSFSDRFALKRHRHVHEKYARTVPNPQQPPTQPSQQQPPPPPPPPSVQQQAAQPQPTQPQQQAQTQTASIEEVYKYDVSGPIAFPGCSRPQDQK